MKNQFLKLLGLSLFLAFMSVSAQVQTISHKVHVSGNCEMCKETIEAAVKKPGVRSASWNVNTKELAVSFDPKKTTLKEILLGVAKSGYDNQMFEASEKDYKSLPSCCQYERKKTNKK